MRCLWGKLESQSEEIEDFPSFSWRAFDLLQRKPLTKERRHLPTYWLSVDSFCLDYKGTAVQDLDPPDTEVCTLTEIDELALQVHERRILRSIYVGIGLP